MRDGERMTPPFGPMGPFDQLETDLIDLAGHVAFPSTPRLSERVRLAIDSGQAERPAWLDRFGGWWRSSIARSSRRSVIFAVAVLLVLAIVALGVGLGLSGLRITFVPEPSGAPATTGPSAPVPTVTSSVLQTPGAPSPTIHSPGIRSPALTPPPSAAVDLAGLRLGRPVSLEAARAAVDFPVLVPQITWLGVPDAVLLGMPPPGGQVALVYLARPDLPPAGPSGVGLILTAFRGGVDEGYFQKGLPPGSTLTRVRVGGQPGFWISGELHSFFYVDRSGVVVEESYRLVGDALIWEMNGVVYRLEAAVGKEVAIAIAESAR